MIGCEEGRGHDSVKMSYLLGHQVSNGSGVVTAERLLNKADVFKRIMSAAIGEYLNHQDMDLWETKICCGREEEEKRASSKKQAHGLDLG